MHVYIAGMLQAAQRLSLQGHCKVPEGRQGRFPAVVDELLSMLQHCCFGDGWPTRLGGLAGVSHVCGR